MSVSAGSLAMTYSSDDVVGLRLADGRRLHARPEHDAIGLRIPDATPCWKTLLLSSLLDVGATGLLASSGRPASFGGPPSGEGTEGPAPSSSLPHAT